jgi:hypothetical protein
MEDAAKDSPVRPIEIRHRWNGRVLFTAEVPDLREAVLLALKSGVSLDGAVLDKVDLSHVSLDGARFDGASFYGARFDGASFYGARFYGARFDGASFYGARFDGASFDGASFDGASFDGASFYGASFYGARFDGASFDGASFDGASFDGASFYGAKLSWSSHDILSEILRLAAQGNVERRKVAGLILVSRDWCWEEFLGLASDPHFAWAMDVLADYVQDGDGAPPALVHHAANLRAVKQEGGQAA